MDQTPVERGPFNPCRFCSWGGAAGAGLLLCRSRPQEGTTDGDTLRAPQLTHRPGNTNIGPLPSLSCPAAQAWEPRRGQGRAQPAVSPQGNPWQGFLPPGLGMRRREPSPLPRCVREEPGLPGTVRSGDASPPCPLRVKRSAQNPPRSGRLEFSTSSFLSSEASAEFSQHIHSSPRWLRARRARPCGRAGAAAHIAPGSDDTGINRGAFTCPELSKSWSILEKIKVTNMLTNK